MDSIKHQNPINSSKTQLSWIERIAQLALLFLIQAYRTVLGPLMGGACRFEPSCSAYAEQAIRVHGSVRGSKLAFKRLAKCHPWGSFGPDPVPSKIHNVSHMGK